ncbi:MAG: transposase [Anaerovoracaceae bacterium]|jgi:putative transposase
MGRKHRVMYSGALYHIIQRGNNRNYIYEDISDKKIFFKLLLDARKKCEFHVLYYVLMDNHYHMILESGDIPISKGIQRLNTAYSKYYNKKYSRSGGIYGGRYTLVLITETKYYYQLLKYIAHNPIKAGLVKKPDEYRWSAHPSIKSGNCRIVNIEKTLSFFPSPKPKALREYIDLIEHDLEIKSDYGMVPVKDEQKLSDALDYILRDINLSEDLIVRIKSGDKSVRLKEARNQFMKEAYKAGFRIKEIANHISYSYEGVRKVVKR